MERDDRRFAVWIGLMLVSAAALPFMMANAAAGAEHVFGGILLNPIDGNTYLAKAYQGWEGGWRFHLPYTAEPGSGAFLNLYYLLIGHLARWTGLPIVVTYNLARVLGVGLMAAALWHYYTSILVNGRQRRWAYALACLALGMGWLLLPSGSIPADFWVAEAYPFLAALTNPHFPLGLALILLLATPAVGFPRRLFLRNLTLAFVLGLVSPFGVAIAVLPWIGAEAALSIESARSRSISVRTVLRSVNVRAAAAILLGGGPVVLYDLIAIRSDPVLAAWDAQNIAVSPPWWDLLLSFSPALLLAAPALGRAPRALAGWLVLGLVLVALPLDLQRRFMMGLYIPLAGLAAVGLETLRSGTRRVVSWLLFICLLPGPLLILLTVRSGIESRSPLLFLGADERAALMWIEANTDPDDLVLASPESGLFVPAYTGRRVIYGHPFETVNAEVEKAAVEAFFTPLDSEGAMDFLDVRRVDWVLFGPRERALGGLPDGLPLELVHEAGMVQVYKVSP